MFSRELLSLAKLARLEKNKLINKKTIRKKQPATHDLIYLKNK